MIRLCIIAILIASVCTAPVLASPNERTRTESTLQKNATIQVDVDVQAWSIPLGLGFPCTHPKHHRHETARSRSSEAALSRRLRAKTLWRKGSGICLQNDPHHTLHYVPPPPALSSFRLCPCMPAKAYRAFGQSAKVNADVG
jgi:hypothetical protein